MARSLNGTTQFLYNQAAPVLSVAPPMTYVCWYKPPDAAATTRPLMTASLTTAANWFMLNVNAANNLQAFEYDGTNVGVAATTTPLVINQWNHCAAVFQSNQVRSVYLNTAKVTDGTNNVGGGGANVFYVGVILYNTSTLLYTPGVFADAAIYAAALTDDEITALSKGVSPLLVRPNALVAYWPLTGGGDPEPDRWRLSANLTVVNAPTVTDNPRIYHPWHTTVPGTTTAAVAQQFQAAAAFSVSATANLVVPVPMTASAGLRFSTAAALAELPLAHVAFYAQNANKTSGVLIHAE